VAKCAYCAKPARWNMVMVVLPQSGAPVNETTALCQDHKEEVQRRRSTPYRMWFEVLAGDRDSD
jgi:hypothetical protein